MFSKTCEYAIKAVIYIAKVSQADQLVSLNNIASAIDSPVAYSSKILRQLVKASIIQSVKGNIGGYFIEPKKLKTLYLSDIVDAIDGDSIYTSCALGLAKCNAKNPCPLHDRFMQVRTDLKLMLENTSLNDMVSAMNEKEFILK